MVISYEPLTLDEATLYGQELLVLNDSEWENWTIENLLAYRARKWELSWMVRVEGAIAGYFIASRIDSAIYLHHIVIGKAYRCLGIGRALLSIAARHALSTSLKYMRLKVHKINERAISLYQGLGFCVIDDSHPELLKMEVMLENLLVGIETIRKE